MCVWERKRERERECKKILILFCKHLVILSLLGAPVSDKICICVALDKPTIKKSSTINNKGLTNENIISELTPYVHLCTLIEHRPLPSLTIFVTHNKHFLVYNSQSFVQKISICIFYFYIAISYIYILSMFCSVYLSVYHWTLNSRYSIHIQFT